MNAHLFATATKFKSWTRVRLQGEYEVGVIIPTDFPSPAKARVRWADGTERFEFEHQLEVVPSSYINPLSRYATQLRRDSIGTFQSLDLGRASLFADLKAMNGDDGFRADRGANNLRIGKVRYRLAIAKMRGLVSPEIPAFSEAAE